MLIKEIIQKKRDNHNLTDNEIQTFIKGISNNTVSPEQIGAMTMAIYFNGLSSTEQVAFTLAMRDSGKVIKFTNLNDKPIVDKHSTGGVADFISIPLAPIIAACGAYVPMITGKGLGHTGGTTDKMQAIPNYNTFPSTEEFQQVVKKVGCCIIGQTDDLAPADRAIYGVRDVSATVESLPLIATSILSKKLASGINYLVMDIKTGNGAFMNTLEGSKALAHTISAISNQAGVPCKAIITDMNEALGRNIGNSLEVVESIQYLTGKNVDAKVDTVMKALATEMLLITKIANSKTDALTKISKALSSGKAAEIFEKMVHAMGGSSNIISKYNQILPKAPIIKPIYANNAGYIHHINSRALGFALVQLGGGRRQATDKLDYAVGIANVIKVGEVVNKEKPIAFIHANTPLQVEEMAKVLNNAITVSAEPNFQSQPTIYETI
ncbi:Thymidine phosphorylase [Candidatus Hepatincola sp. Pdp]